MSRFKTILGAVAIATLLCFSFSANAQENNNRDEYGRVVQGPYLTNRLGDNWFIGVGVGVNTIRDRDVNFKPFGGIATDLSIGKWFTPSVGARLGWRGFQNSYEPNTKYLTSQFKDNKFTQTFIHGDVLWNISNAFGGYKETRTWDLIPYAQFGYLLASGTPAVKGDELYDNEYGAGIGLINDFRLGDRVGLIVDLSGMITKDIILGRHTRYDRFALLPSATVGLTFNLGRSNFDRYASVAPPVLPFTEADYNALKSKLSDAEKENANLKNRVSELESRKPETVYVDKIVSVPMPTTLFFDIGKSHLTKREQAHLALYANENLTPDSKVKVTGAADSATGTPAFNQKLSQKRAEYVKDLLVKKYGLAPENVTIEALGGIAEFEVPAENRIAVVK
jgi:outer membrane protein OmpA-like peptidoglycan-associated protein